MKKEAKEKLNELMHNIIGNYAYKVLSNNTVKEITRDLDIGIKSIMEEYSIDSPDDFPIEFEITDTGLWSLNFNEDLSDLSVSFKPSENASELGINSIR